MQQSNDPVKQNAYRQRLRDEIKKYGLRGAIENRINKINVLCISASYLKQQEIHEKLLEITDLLKENEIMTSDLTEIGPEKAFCGNSIECDLIECLYNNGTCCTKETVTMEKSICKDFADYTLTSREYTEKYYCHVKSKHNKHYRIKRYGKKHIINGHVFYTEDDYRYGLENCGFTEKITGYYCQGTILLDEKNKESNYEIIDNTIKKAVPVKDLPDKPEKKSRKSGKKRKKKTKKGKKQ